MTIQPADIRAAIDVLKQAGEESEDVEFELGVSLIEAITDLSSEARAAKSLIEMAIRLQVEGAPRQIDDKIFMSVNDNRKVFDHDQIEANVVAWAQWRADGDAAEAARQAAWAMRQLYVAPSTGAKVGTLDRLEIDRSSVIEVESRGKKLLVKDVAADA